MYPYSHLPKPLPPAQFYILLVLAQTELHGYALRAAVQNASLGSVVIPDSKLYTLITRLHDEALIDLVGAKPAGKSGQLRTHYTISKYGIIRLEEEARRLDHAVKIAKNLNLLNQQAAPDPNLQRLLAGL